MCPDPARALVQVGDARLVLAAIDGGQALPMQAFGRATGEQHQHCCAVPSID
jgi:hypothetical protein